MVGEGRRGGKRREGSVMVKEGRGGECHGGGGKGRGA